MEHSKKHTRVNDILLGRLERPTLRWLAAHSPAWMTPDLYTATGMLGSVMGLAGYALAWLHPGWLWLATLGLVVHWVGDSMDGTLARYRRIERPVYGYFVDHVLDSVSFVLFFLGLGISPYVSFEVALLALVAFLLLSVLIFLRTYAVGEFRISFNMLGPTEARLLAILLNSFMFFLGLQSWPVSLGALGIFALNPYDLVIAAIGLLALYFFVTTAWADITRLAKEGR